MSITINARGTSVPFFKIGKSGSTIYTGPTDPTGTYTIVNGDVWVNTTAGTFNVRVAGVWAASASTSTFVAKTGDTMSGDLTITKNTPLFVANTTADATQARIDFSYNGLVRWAVGKGNTSETGSNVGSDFNIKRYNDAGAFVNDVVTISRATGRVSFANDASMTSTANTLFTNNIGSISSSAPTTFLNNADWVWKRTVTGGDNEWMRLTSVGNLGIGTASTPTKFAVSNGTNRAELAPGAITYLQTLNEARTATTELALAGSLLSFYTGASGSLAERMRIDNNGNVGIGVIPSAVGFTDSTRTALAIRSQTAGQPAVINLSAGGTAASNNGNIEWSDFGNTAALGFRTAFIYSGKDGSTANNVGSFMGFATKTDGNTNGGSERMRIDQLGNVGIGTTAPSCKLDIVGATQTLVKLQGGATAGQSSAYFVAKPSDGATLCAFGDNAASLGGATGSLASIYTNAGIPLAFTVGATEKARFDTNGNFGIGITPGQRLQVNGGFHITGPATLAASVSPGLFSYDSPIFREFIGDGTGYTRRFSRRSGSVTTDLITIQDTGNVGIGLGSIAAQRRLEVAGFVRASDGTNTNFRGYEFGIPNDAQVYGALSMETNGGELRMQSGYTGWGGLQTFYTNGSERMRIASNGQVGIGGPATTGKLTLTAATNTNNPSDPTLNTIVFRNKTSGVTNVPISGGIFADNYRDVRDPAYTAGVWFERGQASGGLSSSGSIVFGSTENPENTQLPAERARIDPLGNLLVGATAISIPVFGVSGGSQFRTNTDSKYPLTAISGASTPVGQLIQYTAASPNNASNEFILAGDSTTLRFSVRSNGGIANYSANNVNLSDERTKKNITPAGSYLNKMLNLNVVNFLYKDQTDDIPTLGLIAQQVEGVAPEFVDNGGFSDDDRKTEAPLKALYQTDIQFGILKAVQEMHEKFVNEIATLRQRVAELEANQK